MNDTRAIVIKDGTFKGCRDNIHNIYMVQLEDNTKYVVDPCGAQYGIQAPVLAFQEYLQYVVTGSTSVCLRLGSLKADFERRLGVAAGSTRNAVFETTSEIDTVLRCWHRDGFEAGDVLKAKTDVYANGKRAPLALVHQHAT
jgi:hypothetical protein